LKVQEHFYYYLGVGNKSKNDLLKEITNEVLFDGVWKKLHQIIENNITTF